MAIDGMCSTALAVRLDAVSKLAPATREPRQAEAAYIRDLTRIWGVAQAIVAYGLEPLLAVWPEPVLGFDDTGGGNPGGRSPARFDSIGVDMPRSTRGHRCHFRSDRIDPAPYNPLLPQTRRRPIAAMSDAELRRLWPTIEPDAIRRHAPWATSRDEVRRVAFPGQPTASNDDLEAFVRRAVGASQAAPYNQPPPPTGQAAPPGPGAFRLQSRYQVPVVLTAAGAVVPPPPVPQVVTRTTIARQLEWIELAVGETVTIRHLEPVVDAAGRRTDRWATRELQRVIGIDPRADPAVALQLRQWNLLNVNLIESGVRGGWDGRRLRPLLRDVARVVEQAHIEGVRVEVLAGDIRDRFGVSDSRAQLIARDQTLKLNGQLNRSKQQAAGIREYVWVTSRDERVRTEHEALDRSVQSWDVPTSEGFPGDAPQCRCVARAIIPELEV